MSTDLKFEVIPDTFRENLPRASRNERSPLYVQLIAGNTVFIPVTEDLKESVLNKFYEKARIINKKLNKRKTIVNDQAGYVMWFSEKEAV